jgi:hypothetical protein
MDNRQTKESLPRCATEYIELVVKKMGYRRRVRAEVRQELIDHFEDALHGATNEQERVEKAMSLIKEFGEPKTLAKLIRRGKKRCRPLWLKALIRTCQAAGIAFVLLILYIAFLFTGRPNITVDYVARLNELVRPAADEQLNAAPLYIRAGELVINDPNELALPWREPPNKEQLQQLAAWVAENEPAIKLTIEGNQKPCYWLEYKSKSGQVMEITLPSLSPYRTIAYAICSKAYLKASQGDMPSATALLEESLTFSRRIYTKGTLVEQLVSWGVSGITFRTAEAIISDFHPDAQRLAAMQDRLEQALCGADFRVSMDGESMFWKDVLQRTYTSSGRVYAPELLRLAPAIASMNGGDKSMSNFQNSMAILLTLGAPGKGTTFESASAFMEEWQRVASMTPYQARQVGIDMGVAYNKLTRRNIVLRMLLPSCEKVWYQSFIAGTAGEAVIAVVAIHRWRLDKGDWPQSLDELRQGGYMKTVPMDPWSDGPLVYRRIADGFILYSVGVNFKDDGGTSIDKDGKAPGRGGRSNPLNPDALDIVFWPIR